MNIGIVTTWFERGAAYVSRQYKDAFEEQGGSVFIYARGGEKFAKNDPNWDSSKVYWQEKNAFPIYNYVDKKEFESWLLQKKIDVVLFNEQVWFEPVILCKRLGIKVGAYVDYYTELMLPCYDIYDFLICNTKKHLSAFSTHKNAIYCPWGTDVNIFAAHEQRVKSDKVRFFHSCGMNAHRKGTDLLLKAYLSLTIADLKKSELIIHSQLSIDQLGEKLTCEEKKLFESYVKNNNIKIITKTVTAPGLYHLGDVYVYPSRLDGLGLTMAEAKSCSMPLIVPNDGPMNEFINQSIDTAIKINKKFARADGYYWPQNECSITDLTSGLVTYIENREQLSEWQEKARADALENYVWKKNSAFLLDKIKDISITPLDETVVKLCVAFNEKRFPKIYQWKTLYALAFKIYNSIFKS